MVILAVPERAIRKSIRCRHGHQREEIADSLSWTNPSMVSKNKYWTLSRDSLARSICQHWRQPLFHLLNSHPLPFSILGHLIF